MSWFYALQDRKHGPVPASRIAEMSRSGDLTGDDLVWREGLADWLPLRRVAGEIFADGVAIDGATDGSDGDPGTAPVETAVCAYSNRVLPVTEMVPYGDRWIDPRHKDAFVQQLMETGETGGASLAIEELRPMGFWWRVLGSFIDYFIVVIPSTLCMVPYFISSAGSEVTADPENPFNGWTVAMSVTYVLGSLASLAVNAGYHTWMLGKYRATVGKMTIGAVVVSPDGATLSYGRSFCRWLTRTFLNGIIMGVCVALSAVVGVALMAGIGSSVGEGNPGAMMGGIALMGGIFLVGFLIGMFPYWMAAFDPEKRALHDRVCSTRVIRKA